MYYATCIRKNDRPQLSPIDISIFPNDLLSKRFHYLLEPWRIRFVLLRNRVP